MNEKIGVCATGKGPFTRSELKDKINASEKYYFIENINDSVKILLCEDPTANSSKLNKAKEKGIQLVKYEDFDFGEIPSAGSVPQEPKSPKPKKSPKKATSKKIDPKAQRKNEEEALRQEKKRERVRKGLQKYESLPKEYTNSIGMEFVLIPPGEYVREEGDPPVFITEPYYMGKYPVTQGEWLEMLKNPIVGDLRFRVPLKIEEEYDLYEIILNMREHDGREYELPERNSLEHALKTGLVEKSRGNDSLREICLSFQTGSGIKMQYLGGEGVSPKSQEGKLPFTRESGFRVVLRDLEIPEEEIRLCEKRRQIREEGSRYIENWESKGGDRDTIYVIKEVKQEKGETGVFYENLPKEYVNSLGMEFVLIPPGEFLMGAVPQDEEALDDEKPQHKVRITKPFYIGKYPITQEEWEGLMGNNPSYFKEAGKRAPVESVSWKDCQEYIKTLNQKEGKTYRLPTEAEWEYAARGGSKGSETGSYIFTYGDDPSVLGDYAWYEDNSNRTTHPVGEKKPNSIGLYDIMGNVYEWCGDWYDDEKYYHISPLYDPKGAKWVRFEYRSLRGGSWGSGVSRCRLSGRGDNYPVSWFNISGFRLILLP